MKKILSKGIFRIKLLRPVLGRYKRHWFSWVPLQKQIKDWKDMAALTASNMRSGEVNRIIIVPSDPTTLIGAKGDEAMMQATVGLLKKNQPNLSVGVLTATSVADEAAIKLGYIPLPLWREPWELPRIMQAMQEFRPDAIIVVGADVLDGYYSAMHAFRMLAIADIASRAGIKTVILGFSFNNNPSSCLRQILDNFSEQAIINVRDEASYARFKRFTKARANLVADVAFMLEPDTHSINAKKIICWIKDRQSTGDTVLIVNLHPMLISGGSPEQVNILNHAVMEALNTLMQKKKLSILLLSHDYRDPLSDDVCLKYIHARLKGSYAERICYPLDRFSAAELKGIAGEADGVFTGRMHLAIASLGMGVPVAAITYQDKFHGLFSHFDLPKELLLSPVEALRPEYLLSLLDNFLSSLKQLQDQLDKTLPSVLIASEKNLSSLIGQ